MFLDGKSWLASRTIWGGVIATAAPIIGAALGVTITDADVQQTVTLATDGVAVIGGLLAIYGRVRATRVIR